MADRADFIRDNYFDTTQAIIADADDTIATLESLIADAQDYIERIKDERRKYDYALYFSFAKEHRHREHLLCSIHGAKSIINRASHRIDWRFEKSCRTGETIDLLASIITKLSDDD